MLTMRRPSGLLVPRRQIALPSRQRGFLAINGLAGGGGIVKPQDYSVSFDGSNDYLELASNAAWQYGTGAFTLEAWFNFSAIASGAIAVGRYNTGGSYGALQIDTGGTNAYWYYGNGAAYSFALGSTIVGNGWHHVAASRDGSSNLRLFVDGSQKGSTQTDSTNYGGAHPFRVNNAHQMTTLYFTGSVSNLRVLKGTALYTANFTPPTERLTAITNTQLLTCQDATIIDNSSNAFSITNSGGATVSTTNPF